MIQLNYLFFDPSKKRECHTINWYVHKKTKNVEVIYNAKDRVIAVDNVPYRMKHAEKMNKVELINFGEQDDAGLSIREITNDGADVVIIELYVDIGKGTIPVRFIVPFHVFINAL